MKAYITHYALTKGILEMEGEGSENGYFYARKGIYGQTFQLSEWTQDRSVAVSRAAAMRTRKLLSLKKQIAKLEAMRFE